MPPQGDKTKQDLEAILAALRPGLAGNVPPGAPQQGGMGTNVFPASTYTSPTNAMNPEALGEPGRYRYNLDTLTPEPTSPGNAFGQMTGDPNAPGWQGPNTPKMGVGLPGDPRPDEAGGGMKDFWTAFGADPSNVGAEDPGVGGVDPSQVPLRQPNQRTPGGGGGYLGPGGGMLASPMGSVSDFPGYAGGGGGGGGGGFVPGDPNQLGPYGGYQGPETQYGTGPDGKFRLKGGIQNLFTDPRYGGTPPTVPAKPIGPQPSIQQRLRARGAGQPLFARPPQPTTLENLPRRPVFTRPGSEIPTGINAPGAPPARPIFSGAGEPTSLPEGTGVNAPGAPPAVPITTREGGPVASVREPATGVEDASKAYTRLGPGVGEPTVGTEWADNEAATAPQVPAIEASKEPEVEVPSKETPDEKQAKSVTETPKHQAQKPGETEKAAIQRTRMQSVQAVRHYTDHKKADFKHTGNKEFTELIGNLGRTGQLNQGGVGIGPDFAEEVATYAAAETKGKDVKLSPYKMKVYVLGRLWNHLRDLTKQNDGRGHRGQYVEIIDSYANVFDFGFNADGHGAGAVGHRRKATINALSELRAKITGLTPPAGSLTAESSSTELQVIDELIDTELVGADRSIATGASDILAKTPGWGQSAIEGLAGIAKAPFERNIPGTEKQYSWKKSKVGPASAADIRNLFEQAEGKFNRATSGLPAMTGGNTAAEGFYGRVSAGTPGRREQVPGGIDPWKQYIDYKIGQKMSADGKRLTGDLNIAAWVDELGAIFPGTEGKLSPQVQGLLAEIRNMKDDDHPRVKWMTNQHLGHVVRVLKGEDVEDIDPTTEPPFAGAVVEATTGKMFQDLPFGEDTGLGEPGDIDYAREQIPGEAPGVLTAGTPTTGRENEVQFDYNTGKWITRANPNWREDQETAKIDKPMLPEAVRKLEVADAETVAAATGGKKAGAAAGAAGTAKKKSAYQTATDSAFKAEEKGRTKYDVDRDVAYGQGKSQAERAEDVAAVAKRVVGEQLDEETDAVVDHLRDEEMLLSFGQMVFEAFVKIGDGITKYAGGLRGQEGPTMLPTSIVDAINSTGKAKEAALYRLSTFAMTGHLYPSNTSLASMHAQSGMLQHSQNLEQKNRHFLMGLEQKSWEATLNYNEKILGRKLDVARTAELRRQWEDDFADKREQFAYTYSLDRAKANMENLGNIRLDRIELDTIEGLLTTIDMGKAVLKDKPQYETGWAKNIFESMGNYFGWGNPRWHNFKQKVTTQLNTYVNRLTGKQLSKHEVGRLKGAVPQITDDDAIFTAKCKTFIAIQKMILKRKLRTYAQNGHDVTPFMREVPLNWEVKMGNSWVEKDGSVGSYRDFIQRNPNLLTEGKIRMLDGPQGNVIREGEEYLPTIMGDFITQTADGGVQYAEDRYGVQQPSDLPFGQKPAGQYYTQGVARAYQHTAAPYLLPGLRKGLGGRTGL